MAKKKKNVKHAEAIKRKSAAEKEMAKLGLDLSDNTAIIGLVFEHLAVSQLTYFGIQSINKICKLYAGIDIVVFSQHIIPPCINPACSVFDTSELDRWSTYPLITTSISTTIEALSGNAPVIYHYSFDPTFIDRQYCKSDELKRAFCDPRVKVVVRHKSHKQLIEEEFDIDVCDTIIPDCNIESLAKLVLTEMKTNGC